MRTLILGAILVGLLQTPQTPSGMGIGAPMFRSGVQVVPVSLRLIYNRKPWIGLTREDFMLVLDKTSHAPAEVTHDADTPHLYTLFFQPPDTARDGKRHKLEVKVKLPNAKWKTLPFSQSITLPKMDSVASADVSVDIAR